MPVLHVPAGYAGSGFAVHTGVGAKGTAVAPDAHGLSFWEIQSVFTNPCTAGKYSKDVGPSVADLAKALDAQPLRAATNPVPVQIAGYHGLYLQASVPAHIDFAKCQDGYFDTWTSTSGNGHFQQGPGQQDRIWILKVHGAGGRGMSLPYRLVIDGWHMPGTTQHQINQINQMVQTITFQAIS